ncbi:MAG: DUF4292 domain-containing protein [Bacteroides sp.]|nr:DUF4292 domain-containing protein [Bacteroides sp.]
MKQMFCCKPLALVCLLMAVLLVGCKTTRTAERAKGMSCLSSKVELTVPHKHGNALTVGGTLKLKSGELAQLSFLMPILRSEVARVEVSPDAILLVDRMGKRYVRATRQELKQILPRKATFERLEKLLFDAAKPNGKRTLTGSELGIPSMEKAAIRLYDFSDKEIAVTPTVLSAKYREVPLEEMLEMLLSIVNER